MLVSRSPELQPFTKGQLVRSPQVTPANGTPLCIVLNSAAFISGVLWLFWQKFRSPR
jgi:hypothetical protein